MARAYGDDLRVKFLSAHDRGEGTLGELASVFGVSAGRARKISSPGAGCPMSRFRDMGFSQPDPQTRSTLTS